MPMSKVSTKRQMTIPIKVLKALNLEIGDLLEVDVENGKGIFAPRRLAAKAPVPKLSAVEQHTLEKAQKKIAAINNNLLNSHGLTKQKSKLLLRLI